MTKVVWMSGVGASVGRASLSGFSRMTVSAN